MKISEIFQSINGECCYDHQGSLCTFVRVQGCNLACKYPCDTKYAQDFVEGKEISCDEVVKTIESFGNTNVTITGGEPLIQMKDVFAITNYLHSKRYKVSIETNGSIIDAFDYSWRCSFVADYKLPSSGMTDFMDDKIFKRLYEQDFIKFVCLTREDFDFAINKIEENNSKCRIAFSPVFGRLESYVLYDWMKDNLLLRKKGAVLSLQLHKIIKVK